MSDSLYCLVKDHQLKAFSVLVHPNTGDGLKDHSALASWMGTPWPLKLHIFQKDD